MIIPISRFVGRSKGRSEYDIVGKKASIIKLCREGKLKPRKCRRYRVMGGG